MSPPSRADLHGDGLATSMNDNRRRLLLRLGVKLMSLIAIGFSAYVLFPSTGEQNSQRLEQPVLRIHLDHLAAGDFQRIPWQGGNLILLRRNETMLKQLMRHMEQLSDPVAAHDPLPVYIAFDRGSGLGCPMQWVPPADNIASAPVQPWPGGLRDSCDGSWYDAAGRIFKGQAAARNLKSPDYRLEGELLIVGANSDNPDPAE